MVAKTGEKSTGSPAVPGAAGGERPPAPNFGATGFGATSFGRGTSAPPPHEPIAILLVDDDPDCRMLVRDAIEESKVSNRVFEVSDGREAVDFLCRRGAYADAPRPGLIYLDIEMPGMNGQETLKRIRTLAEYRDTPVVMMTGVSDERQMLEAAANGANSYTLKPANAEQFLRTVLASTTYWLTIHQYPGHRLPPEACRR